MLAAGEQLTPVAFGAQAPVEFEARDGRQLEAVVERLQQENPSSEALGRRKKSQQWQRLRGCKARSK